MENQKDCSSEQIKQNKFYFKYPNGDESSPNETWIQAYDQMMKARERCGWWSCKIYSKE